MEEVIVKADAVTVDAPTANNVIVDAPVTAEPVVAEPVVTETVVAEPVAVEPVTEAATVQEPANNFVQSQADYFASAFNYEQPAQNTQAQNFVQNGSGQGNYSAGSSGPDYYGYSNTAQNTGFGAQENQSSGFGTQNSGYGFSNGNYGVQNAGYGATNSGFAGNGYSNPGNAYGGYSGQNGYANQGNSFNGGYPYNNQEYSQPDYYGQNVYANDPFASYYDEDEYKRPGNGLAIGALVCGIVSLALTCSGIGIVPGIIAIVLGIKGSKECEKTRMASIGMILGIVGCLVNLFRFASLVIQIVTAVMDYF